MIVATLPLLWRSAIILLAGIGAGISNGIAGGGTFITFPTLLATGIQALQANVSATVGVVPSSLGGIRGFRHEIAARSKLIRTLLPSALAGTIVGCVLLLTASPGTFRAVVPWLIGAGTLLFALAPRITKRLAHIDHSHPGRRWTLYVGVFLASIYGGYFGAGLGILLLAIMAVSLPYEMPDLQGIRNLLTLIVNSCAAVIFIFRGHLALDAVYMLLIGTFIGGWLGTLLITRLSPQVVRFLVIATGVATTIRLATN